jgi:hypothetical protein
MLRILHPLLFLSRRHHSWLFRTENAPPCLSLRRGEKRHRRVLVTRYSRLPRRLIAPFGRVLALAVSDSLHTSAMKSRCSAYVRDVCGP